MLRRLSIAMILFLAPGLLRSADVLDRVAATVNGYALLQSDVDDELRYECFATKRSLAEISSADENGALDRLIDQELLREQMRSADFKAVKSEDVAQALQKFKADYGANRWSSTLAGYGITEDVVKDHIQAELNQLRLIDLRLRSSIHVDAESVRTYYEQELLPKLPSGQHPTLQQAAPKIQEVLIEQRMNESLDSWLHTLRSQAKIQRFSASDQAK